MIHVSNFQEVQNYFYEEALSMNNRNNIYLYLSWIVSFRAPENKEKTKNCTSSIKEMKLAQYWKIQTIVLYVYIIYII